MCSPRECLSLTHSALTGARTMTFHSAVPSKGSRLEGKKRPTLLGDSEGAGILIVQPLKFLGVQWMGESRVASSGLENF